MCPDGLFGREYRKPASAIPAGIWAMKTPGSFGEGRQRRESGKRGSYRVVSVSKRVVPVSYLFRRYMFQMPEPLPVSDLGEAASRQAGADNSQGSERAEPPKSGRPKIGSHSTPSTVLAQRSLACGSVGIRSCLGGPTSPQIPRGRRGRRMPVPFLKSLAPIQRRRLGT